MSSGPPAPLRMREKILGPIAVAEEEEEWYAAADAPATTPEPPSNDEEEQVEDADIYPVDVAAGR